MDAEVTERDVAALRRAAFGPPPVGADAREHARAAAEARGRLRAMEAADEPVGDDLPDPDESAIPAPDPAAQPRRLPRPVLAVGAGVLLLAALVGAGAAGWRLGHPPLAELPGNVPRTDGLAVGELRVVANWNGRTISIGDWIDHPGGDCLVVAYGADGGGAACGDPPTLGLPVDPGALGTSTQTAFSLAEFTWHRGSGLVIQYRGETTVIEEGDAG